jgi:hypothetical protein
MKKIILTICTLALITLFFPSCKKANQPTNQQGNFLKFTVGSNNYKAIEFLSSFDEGNSFDIDFAYPTTDKSISGYIDGNYDVSFNWLTYYITINSTLTKVTDIGFIDNSGCGGGYCCQGTSSSAPLNVNLNITRNDNTIGGIIEGNFSGTVGKKISSCAPTGCASNVMPLTINGSFRLKIQ